MDGAAVFIIAQRAAVRRPHRAVFADGIAMPAVKGKGFKRLVFLGEDVFLPFCIERVEVLQHAHRAAPGVHIAGKILSVGLHQPPVRAYARAVGQIGLVGGVDHVVRHAGHAARVGGLQIGAHGIAVNHPARPILPGEEIIGHRLMMAILPIVKLHAVDMIARHRSDLARRVGNLRKIPHIAIAGKFRPAG